MKRAILSQFVLSSLLMAVMVFSAFRALRGMDYISTRRKLICIFSARFHREQLDPSKSEC